MNRPTIQAFHGSNSTDSLQVSGRQEYELGPGKKKKKKAPVVSVRKGANFRSFYPKSRTKKKGKYSNRYGKKEKPSAAISGSSHIDILRWLKEFYQDGNPIKGEKDPFAIRY